MAFSKGTSGNPNGRPSGSKSRTTITKNRQSDALKVLETVMKDASVDATCRVQAAALILYNQAAA